MATLNRSGDRSGKLSDPIFNKKHRAERADSGRRRGCILSELSLSAALLPARPKPLQTESPTGDQVFKLASGDISHQTTTAPDGKRSRLLFSTPGLPASRLWSHSRQNKGPFPGHCGHACNPNTWEADTKIKAVPATQ